MLHQKKLQQLLESRVRKEKTLENQQQSLRLREQRKLQQQKSKAIALERKQDKAIKDLKQDPPTLKRQQTVHMGGGVMAQIQNSVSAQIPQNAAKKLKQKKLVPMSLRKTLERTRELKQKTVVQLKAAHGEANELIRSGSRKTFSSNLGKVKKLTPKTLRVATIKGLNKMRQTLAKMTKKFVKNPRARHIDDDMKTDSLGMA